MIDDWLPVRSIPRVIFQFAPKLAVFGHLSQFVILANFDEIIGVFSVACRLIPYQGFELRTARHTVWSLFRVSAEQ
jgi:hypothetical protein